MVEVEEDLREAALDPTRVLAFSPKDLSASLHRLVLLVVVLLSEEAVVDRLPLPPPPLPLLLIAMLLLATRGEDVVMDDTDDVVVVVAAVVVGVASSLCSDGLLIPEAVAVNATVPVVPIAAVPEAVGPAPPPIIVKF